METEELIKLVDGIYKNILDKFNPGARQMINAGKAYLKALHGAAAASRIYVDAISKLARQAQQGTWGGSSDIGAALTKMVEVYKEIQDQQMNILKAFYVDLLVPLETNLEKDTKVVQSEQKRFLQQHKQRAETYSKAAAMMKKQRKKSRTSQKTGLAMDKELKNMQILEEEKTKLDAFCEQSLKNAMTQERRRYGFVLERQCSLAKHYLSYHQIGSNSYQQNLDKWSEIAKTREFLPESVENIFSNRLRQISVWQDDDVYSNPRSPNLEEDRLSISSQLRKTKSMDASCLDMRSIGEATSPVTTLARAKSEYNLNSSSPTVAQECPTPTRRPKSMAVPPPPQWDTQLARALYAYLSSGDNQLSFLEGDLIALIGDRNKGWQFGENLRTQCSGWFPLAYTELTEEPATSPTHRSDATGSSRPNSTPTNSGPPQPAQNAATADQPARMFGDTLHLHRSSNNAKQIRRAIASNSIPPPALPAPVPTPTLPSNAAPSKGMSQSHSANFAPPTAPTNQVKSSASSFGFAPPAGGYSTHPQPGRPLPLHIKGKVGNASLHSSNDSGFSNDPPPQPEVDYSDDESIGGKMPPRRPRAGDANNNTPKSPNIRQSNSHGNLTHDHYPDRNHGVKVKRTKSFWKFGKNASDNEILEGMALWRHRDLVDVDNVKVEDKVKRPKATERKREPERPVRERSNDSERTLKTSQRVERKRDVEPRKTDEPIEKEYPDKDDMFDNEFFDDDGLMIMKTVNRKNIIQQYANSESESECDSELISDDPYSIVVEDQKMQKSHFPNVAEIGKKLEKLSKSSKFSPNAADDARKHNKYESIDSECEKKNRKNAKSSRRIQAETARERAKYYDSTQDELSDGERQFLPRTKLTKTHSNNSEMSIEYGETLQKRLKNQYGVMDEKSKQGNMYGPWYDLWGLDASARK